MVGLLFFPFRSLASLWGLRMFPQWGSASVVVLAATDGTAHGAEDPKDRANDQQDDADGHEHGEAFHE